MIYGALGKTEVEAEASAGASIAGCSMGIELRKLIEH
jgi:hypothetical protein